MSDTIEKHENESGQVGVIVSCGFGAGWSTWADGNSEYYCMDSALVGMKLRGALACEVESHVKKVTGGTPFMAGWDSAEVVWIDKGTRFVIDMIDGSESLRTLDDLYMEA